MKCPICSAKISDTDAFCPNCGSAVKSETSGYMDSIDTSNLGGMLVLASVTQQVLSL